MSADDVPRGWDERLEAFLRFLGSVRNLSPRTVASYRSDLQAFLRWCGRSGVDPSSLDPRQVRAYLADQRKARYAERTVSRRLSALRTFYGWLEREGDVEVNAPAAASGAKASRRLPEPMGDGDVVRMLGAVDRSDAAGLRDAAQIELMYASGARIAEVAALRVGDIDFSTATVRLFGKGSKERMVPLYPRALRAVGDYLADGRPELAAKGRRPSDALFLSSRGNPMGTDALRLRFERAATAAGLPSSVTPHTMRHTYATELLSGGADLRSVQELLGHASISTTQVYTHLSVDRLKEAALQAHPRSGN